MDKNELQKLIQGLIEKTTELVGDISITEKGRDDKSKTIWFNIEVKDPHLYLGRDAEALYALNHIARRFIENKTSTEERLDILIDINGFQKKKVEGVEAIAHMMAERARYFKSTVEIDPMSAFERKIIHEFLGDAEDLKTESEGMGRSRRVVIKYIGS